MARSKSRSSIDGDGGRRQPRVEGPVAGCARCPEASTPCRRRQALVDDNQVEVDLVQLVAAAIQIVGPLLNGRVDDALAAGVGDERRDPSL